MTTNDIDIVSAVQSTYDIVTTYSIQAFLLIRPSSAPFFPFVSTSVVYFIRQTKIKATQKGGKNVILFIIIVNVHTQQIHTRAIRQRKFIEHILKLNGSTRDESTTTRHIQLKVYFFLPKSEARKEILWKGNIFGV